MADDRKGGALAAGVAGAVIGAAAAAAAIALSDEKNRKKAQAVLKNLEKEGSKIFKEISKKAMELKDAVYHTKSKAESTPKKLKAKS